MRALHYEKTFKMWHDYAGLQHDSTARKLVQKRLPNGKAGHFRHTFGAKKQHQWPQLDR